MLLNTNFKKSKGLLILLAARSIGMFDIENLQNV